MQTTSYILLAVAEYRSLLRTKARSVPVALPTRGGRWAACVAIYSSFAQNLVDVGRLYGLF